MSQPQPPTKNVTADDGFRTLTQVLSVWVPARLWHTRRAGLALRALRGKAHP